MIKIIDLDIDELLSGDTRIEEIALVLSPAIEQEWLYMSAQQQEQFESYTDYPKAATENACRAVRWAEENGWGDCGTDVGKTRAHQLCNGEPISEETISRMSGFRRHQQNKDVPYDEGCGGLMWDAWGGDEGIDYAERKLKQIRNESLCEDGTCNLDEDFDLDNTIELEELLDEGYVITEAREIDPEDIVKEYKETFNSSDITEEKFYTLTSSPSEPSILDSPYRLRRYVYSIGPQGGPDLIPTSRLFCRKMMGKRQLVWRFEDLTMLSTQLNSEDRKRTIIPRPKGARVDVFLYAGGANCRHRFLELSLDPTEKVYNNKQRAERSATVTLDAPGLAGRVNEPVQVGRQRDPSTLRQESMSSIETPIGFLQGVPVFSTEDEAKRHSTNMGCEGVYEKVDYLDGEGFRPCRVTGSNKFSEKHYNFRLDDEKRMIYSPAMIPNKLIRRVDPVEGEYFVRFSPESIERAAHKYLMERRVGPEFVNLEHTETKFDEIYLVESWITTENDKLYDLGFDKKDVPVGSWAVGYKVKNDDVWENYVKKGLVKGLSVEGLFDMSFNSHKTDEYLLDEIINILNDIK